MEREYRRYYLFDPNRRKIIQVWASSLKWAQLKICAQKNNVGNYQFYEYLDHNR